MKQIPHLYYGKRYYKHTHENELLNVIELLTFELLTNEYGIEFKI